MGFFFDPWVLHFFNIFVFVYLAAKKVLAAWSMNLCKCGKTFREQWHKIKHQWDEKVQLKRYLVLLYFVNVIKR